MIIERPALERRVLASTDAGRIPVVLGGCGSGRTSLLLRVERLIGTERAQYLNCAAAATTPERCLATTRHVSRLRPAPSGPIVPPSSAREAFDDLMTFFDRSLAANGGAPTFLLDDAFDIRTFESFPGLRHVQREVVTRLAASPSTFVLASKFTSRAHRLLRDAPARFEVVHVPPLHTSEVVSLAMLVDGGRRDWAEQIAAPVAALSGGRAAYAHLLLEALAAMGPAIDPVAALAALLAPGGRLAARCRESYEFRLHRARGYGALKAILAILADDEPLNLTEVSQHLRRTPGSTKDYLSWLEDVDLIRSQGKRYTFDDPMLRLYVRLYERPVPPTDADIVREVRQFAQSRLPRAIEAGTVPVMVTTDRPTESERSGIIEID